MNRIIISCILSMMSFASFAQNNVSGKVYDSNTNEPLKGATIHYQGHNNTTAADGTFILDCNITKPVTVSFVGYEPYQFTIKNCGEHVSIPLVPVKVYLEAVEITATSSTNKSLLSQPASITKLTSAELKRGNGLFLDDAINGNVPGVIMQRRTVAAGQQFNIRGYGNGARGTNGVNSNFDGQGYKVYLNGIPITDAEGITLMDDIDFGSVGNVEVTKGPAGSLYGLAIAGVVNLKTTRPEKGKTSIGQDAMAGSYGLQRYTTRFQMATDHSSLLVNYGNQHCDGFMSHTKSRKTFINIAGEFQATEKQHINFYAGYSNSYDERGGELTIDQYNNFDYTGNPAYIKNNAHSNIISVRGGVGHTYKFNNNFSNTTSIFASGVSNNVSSAGGWTDKAPVNYGARTSFDTRFSLSKDITLSGISGVETQHQYAQVTAYAMVRNPLDTNGYNIVGAQRSNQVITTRTTSAFSEWTLGLPADISVTAGVGVSFMEITLNDRFYIASNTTKPYYYSASYNGLVSPHVAINKVFNKTVSVYASYSKGYKAPVSTYFYIPFTGEVNKHLKSEIGNQFEIGTKGNILNDRLSYELALFYTKFTNKMTAVAVPNAGNTATLYSYMVNGGSQDHKGGEFLAKYTVYQSGSSFVSKVRPFANFTYSDFKYKDFRIQKSITLTEDYSGKAVAGVPKFTANAGIDLLMKYGLYANVTYAYKDGVAISSDGLNNATSFMLLNSKLGINTSISKHFDIDAYFGVNNITGVQYYYMVFSNQLPDAYLPAPHKANYFGGVNITYNF